MPQPVSTAPVTQPCPQSQSDRRRRGSAQRYINRRCHTFEHYGSNTSDSSRGNIERRYTNPQYHAAVLTNSKYAPRTKRIASSREASETRHTNRENVDLEHSGKHRAERRAIRGISTQTIIYFEPREALQAQRRVYDITSSRR